jgi:hypothetical protein
MAGVLKSFCSKRNQPQIINNVRIPNGFHWLTTNNTRPEPAEGNNEQRTTNNEHWTTNTKQRTNNPLHATNF